jgi:hypothetical protein
VRKTKIVLNNKSEIVGDRPEPYEVTKWWQWILSFDKYNNPLEGINVKQNLPFLCLACTGGGEDVTRKMRLQTRDAEKDLLIPIFTSEYSTAELGSDASDARLLSQAKDDVRHPIYLELIIDEKPVQNIERFYVEAGPFAFKLPPQHILDNDKIVPGVYRAMCAGYWMKLKSLRGGGRHEIQFGGTGRNGFHTKVRYSIEVPTFVFNQPTTR